MTQPTGSKKFADLDTQQRRKAIEELHLKLINDDSKDASNITDPAARAEYQIFLGELAQKGLSEPDDYRRSLLPPDPNIYLRTAKAARDAMGLSPSITSPSGKEIPNPYSGLSLFDVVPGAAETAASFITGGVSVGLAAANYGREALVAAFTDKTFYDAMFDATEDAEKIIGTLTYQPRTQSGQDMTAVVSAPFLAFDQATTAAQNLVTNKLGGRTTGGVDPAISGSFSALVDEIQGFRDRGETVPQDLLQRANMFRSIIAGAPDVKINNPAIFAGATTKAFLDFAPDIAGAGRSQAVKMRARSEFRQMARDYNIDLSQLTEKQVDELAESAQTLVGQNTVGGSIMADGPAGVNVPEALKHQRQIMYNISQQLFEEAKNTDAYFPDVQLKALDGAMAHVMQDYRAEFANLRVAPRRLREFSDLVREFEFEVLPQDGGAPVGFVPINKLHAYRQRLNSDIRRLQRSTRDYDTNLELDTLQAMRTTVDDFLESQLIADLSSNNTEAISKWRNANEWYKNFKNTFEKTGKGEFAGNAIAKILNHDMTAEQVSRVIIGTNVLSKPEAGLIVDRLNTIFGNDSAQMEALRKEVIFQMLPPLLQDSPNLGGFIKKYEEFRRGNDSLVQSLFQGDSLKNLEDLVRLARADKRVADRQQSQVTARTPGLDRVIAANTVGSGLARAQTSMGLAQTVVNKLSTVARKYGFALTNPSDSTLIMNEFYGTNIGQIPFGQIQDFPRNAAVLESVRQVEESQNRDTLGALQSVSQRAREETARRTNTQ